jgi:phosphoserine phosphatase
MKTSPKSFSLAAPGWSDSNRSRLEQLLRDGADNNHAAVFDFDNTIVCGDIGEATLAWMVKGGALSSSRLSRDLCPPLVLPDGREATLAEAIDATEYYEAFLAPTMHGAADPTPLANGYAWAVEIMDGVSLLDVVRATRDVMAQAQGAPPCQFEVTPGKTSYPIPFFYPEIVELIAALIRHRFQVWIVSASNVWSVRWMVLNGLNTLLKEHGVRTGLPPERVVGVSTLLADRRGGLHKDSVLTRENSHYAALDEEALKTFRLTRLMQYPVPTYSGKVAAIWDHLGRRPFLCAGDSPGDLPMLSFSEHKLWIARLEKTDYQKIGSRRMRETGLQDWIIQPTLAKKAPGFLPDPAQVRPRLGTIPPAIRASLRTLRSLNAF